MILSSHFKDNWQVRVGGEPTEAQIEQLCRESVVVQRARSLMMYDGTPFRTLTLFWHPEKKIVIKLDEFAGVAVSVLCADKRRMREGAV